MEHSVAAGDAEPITDLTGALGSLRAVALRVMSGVGDAGVVSDAQFVQVLELTGELHRLTGALMAAGFEQIQERSTSTGMSEGLFRRLGFHSDTEMAEHVLGISPGLSNSLKRLTHAAAAKPAGSLGVEPVLPLVGEAVAAGEITVDQAQIITKHLTPVHTRVEPEDLEAAEASLVGLASGGRMGTPPDMTAAPDDVESGAGETEGGEDFDGDPDGADDIGEDSATDAAGILAEPGAPTVLRDVRVRPKALEGPAALWVAAIDPDGKAPSEAARRRRRSLIERRTPDGGVRLTADLSPEAAEQWELLKSTFLSPYNDCPAPDSAQNDGTGSDSAQAGEAGAGGAVVGGDAGPGFVVEAQGLGREHRSLAQKQHDALLEIFRLAVNAAPMQGASRPHLVVITRAESIAKALGGRDGVVDEAVAAAITELADAARSGTLPAEAVAAITTLAGLLATATMAAPTLGDNGMATVDPKLIRPATDNDQSSGLDVDPAPGTAQETGPVPGTGLGVGSVPGAGLGVGPDSDAGLGVDAESGPASGSAGNSEAWRALNDARLLSGAGPEERRNRAGGVGRFDPWAPPGPAGGVLPVTGSWLSMESVGAMLCDGVLEVLITRDGAPLALRSAQARFFTPKQRQALAAIYPHCAVPGCPVPAIAGHAHHIVPVSEGGETSVENGIILCTFHHNQLHAGHYRIVPNPQLARRGSGQEPLPGMVVIPTSSGGHGVNRTARPHAPTQTPEPVNLTDRIAWTTASNSGDSEGDGNVSGEGIGGGFGDGIDGGFGGSDGAWATPGVDARTIAGWGQDSPALAASKRAWAQSEQAADSRGSARNGPASGDESSSIDAKGWGSSTQSGIDANGWGLPGVGADESQSTEEEKTEDENAEDLEPTEKLTPRWGQSTTPSQVQTPRPASESMATGRRYELRGGPEPETPRTQGPVDYIDMGAPPPRICFAI